MITPDERKWIEKQLQEQGLKGPAAQKFTNDMINYFGRRHKQPSKPDFAPMDIHAALPGYADYLKTKK